MSHLVFFLEERSAKEMLQGLLPRVIPEWKFRFIVFEGKSDLKKRLLKRLLVLSSRAPNTHFVVMLDQDSSDCKELKQHIRTICEGAGCSEVLIRIVCRELESWYLADLRAVEKGLELPKLARHQERRVYRDPDAQHNPADRLRELTGKIYQKVMGSRQIGLYLDPANKRSRSFRNFITGIRRIAGTQP